jgi:DNA-3-methyladenine glycosylase
MPEDSVTADSGVAADGGVATDGGVPAAELGRAEQAAGGDVGVGDAGAGVGDAGASDAGAGRAEQAVSRGTSARRGEVLPRAFFGRPSQEVAPDLLGCVLESELPDGLVAVILTEIEAYAGQADPASHAYRGPTRRNAVMFGEPGHAYVYFTYGMHFCVNLVCLPAGTASAVLLRAGSVVAGADLARRRRAATRSARSARSGPADRDLAHGPAVRSGPADRDLARGPARLCQALGIDRTLDGVDACDPGSVLRIRPGSRATPPGMIRSGPRVGVSQAADEPWRFWVAGDPTVSAYRAYAPRRAKPSAG